jgi:TRAP-type uncharacterized transport system substrate-binding protein
MVLNWWPWLFLIAAVVAIGWLFVQPAPPSRVIIASGSPDSGYAWFVRQYAKTFSENGVELQIEPTAGSVENYRRLDAAAPSGPRFGSPGGVSVAIVQSGTCPEGIRSEIRAVASLYLEPIWVFHRGDASLQLEDLRGLVVAVGPEGSGSRSIAQRLFSANKMPWTDEMPPATRPTTTRAASRAATTRIATTTAATRPAVLPPVYFDTRGDRAAADALRAGQVDVGIFVFTPRHPLAAELLADPSLKLMSFNRHEAYARNFPFLSDVKLPRGTVDLSRDLPPSDVFLLAPAANLVCRSDLHPAIVELLVKAAVEAHERGDLLSTAGKLPSTQYVEFPIAPAADSYFKHGTPYLQRILPFKVAAFVDRMKILLLPLITLLIPLSRLVPPVYVWRIRSRIYRWYRVLREIDRRLREDAKMSRSFAEELAVLQEMEKELSEQKVPLSYAQEFYNLRLHTEYLRRRVEEREAARIVLENRSAGPAAT